MIEETALDLENKCLIKNKIILVKDGIQCGYVNNSWYDILEK